MSRSYDTPPQVITQVLDSTISFPNGRLSIAEATERGAGQSFSSPLVVWTVAELATRNSAENPLTRYEMARLAGVGGAVARNVARLLLFTGVADEGGVRVEGVTRPVTTLVPSQAFPEFVAQTPVWQAAIADRQAG